MPPKTTARIAISPVSIDAPQSRQALAHAAQILRSGGTVAFPTETVYGLGANALDEQAVAGIFIAKQRPAWDPLIVHISDLAMLDQVVVRIPPRAQKLIEAFWPGPLTLLLPKRAAVPETITAGRPLIGVRMPAHPVAHALVAAAGVPIAAPSANRFGHASPTTAQHVLDDLDGRIDLLLDAGPTSFGVESSVIEITEQSIILYRPGAISAEEIEAISGPVESYQSQKNIKLHAMPESLPSPGVGIRHYAPNASVVPVDIAAGSEADQNAEWLRAVQQHSPSEISVGVMLPLGWPLPENFRGVHFDWGPWQNKGELAQRLFAGLRALDTMGAERILCPLPSPSGVGAAIRDRVLKAAREE